MIQILTFLKFSSEGIDGTWDSTGAKTDAVNCQEIASQAATREKAGELTAFSSTPVVNTAQNKLIWSAILDIH